ncbi:MAG TPA: DUF3443 domain-containing protein [Steroidobacteraceae bacterium]
MLRSRSLRWTWLLAVAALSACGGGGGSSSAGSGSGGGSSGSSGSSSSSGGAVNNTVAVSIGPGPTHSSSFFNIPYATVTVCIAGTNSCQSVDDVLVDTGSYGLRLLASALNGLALGPQMDPNTSGNTIAECLPFADGYTWGPVATADVTIGGEVASAVPVNIIDDTGSFAPTVPSSCTSNGASLNSVDDLGANGVLGVGVFSTDCGSYCDQPVSGQSSGYVYYTCTASACSPVREPLMMQVVNPVTLFAKDNNGVILELAAIAASGATSATGTLIFGIGTESNNGLGSATVLTTDDAGDINTTLNGQMLADGGFLDSGSNALFFPDSNIPTCSGSNNMFYCPASTVMLAATNLGHNGTQSTLQLPIAPLTNFSSQDFALDDIGGPASEITGLGAQYFDFGLPFFFGRNVYTAIEGVPAGGTMGPYYAY